ncbi:hypothetical protein HELRODRAFT_73826 [Helobdella robusta]|uniref:PX domain-containing protein n=1 Tax=Helobdella robusta TaxID=6412 RepID=T1G1I8_HELRO|nr:hypothetical protein HELRODRAFT_73826 [Helobdella robusta]ESO09425.1 hypothetical protein HELRODRAFT_73826 [Helobdella robusta]
MQIAEMHGELMEFNEKLHKKLLNREKQMRTMHIVIEDLKRKVVFICKLKIVEKLFFLRSNSLSSQSMNLIIPAAFLQGSSKGPYHVYQIYIKIRNEEWIIYRRYTDFFELHHSLKKYFQIVKQFNFPPKKTFGKMDPKLVEDRRKGLEDYLRKVLFMLHENCPQFANSPCRITLLTVLPFFRFTSLINFSNFSYFYLH